MAQRHSGRARIERDKYDTPDVATICLLKKFPLPNVIWEPAAGDGQMASCLARAGKKVYTSDIADTPSSLVLGGCQAIGRMDFLDCERLPYDDIRAIVTNPPFNRFVPILERALALTEPVRGRVAMLLPSMYDHGNTRYHLFGDCPAYAGQIKLTDRIIWFEPEPGVESSPSENHTWFCWDWLHEGRPWVLYQGWKKKKGRSGE